jgi:hypothetical protein
MLLKLKNDGETILSFDYEISTKWTSWDAQVSEVKMLDEKGRIQYKYVDGQLVKLTHQEKINHPLWKKAKENKRIEKLKKKIQELKELNEIKESADLTNSEKTEVVKRINDKTAESIDDASDDL